MRLIDADALVEDIGKEINKKTKVILLADYNHYYCSGMRNAIRLVKRLPTVEPVKHGHWEYLGERDGAHVFECSECHDRINTVNPNWLSKYCSGCGAKMEVNTND